MNKRRLKTLAKFLATKVKPENFHMEAWANVIDNGRPACGTTACALGWATTIPSFRRAGLRLTKDRHQNIYITLGDMRHSRKDHPADRSIEAAKKFFGIDTGEAEYLFTIFSLEYGEGGIENVIRRINEVIDSN